MNNNNIKILSNACSNYIKHGKCKRSDEDCTHIHITSEQINNKSYLSSTIGLNYSKSDVINYGFDRLAGQSYERDISIDKIGITQHFVYILALWNFNFSK